MNKTDLKEIENKKLAEIEKELLIAPLRIFRLGEKRGYFAPELVEKFGVTEDLMFIMIAKRKTFGHQLRDFNGEKKYFFWLK